MTPWSPTAHPPAVVLAATPIGNTEDASAHLRRLLAEADVVAAEDTRRLRALAARLGVEIGGRVLSYHEHNEVERVGGAARGRRGRRHGRRRDGRRDARRLRPRLPRGGAPRSPPACPSRRRPGPSAVLTALALSGLPTDRFCFEGFPPRKPGERARAFELLADERRTMVFFEAPHRLDDTLAAMAVGVRRATGRPPCAAS